MGCCLTTAAAADDSKPRDAPPPPPLVLFEEESVKEVLSETPVIPKQPPPSNSTTTKITGENQRVVLKPVEEFRSRNDVVQSTKTPIEENASEVSSEMYTCSASFSAATTTTTIGTGVDEDGEVTQKVNKPSPAKMVRRRQPTTFSSNRVGRKERSIRPSPQAKSSAIPSTDKKPQRPSRNTTTSGRHRNVEPSNVVRRETPDRRSRSPAMRGEAGQLRKVERSPVRQTANRVPVTVTEKGGNVKLKKTNDRGVVPALEPEPEPEPETGESLENPLVSLECFIFL